MRFDLVINLFIGQALSQHKITVEGGKQWRPFIHVEDAATAYLLALEKKPSKIRGIFNLGGDELNYQLNDIGKLIKNNIEHVKVEHSIIKDKRNYRVSFKKIKHSFNFEPKRTIPYAIEEIKNVIKRGYIKDWKKPIYYNNRFPLVGLNKSSKYYWQ